jgi:hypothetical protein
MFRRGAFERAGGYPEHHGFDTQAFCMRFLSRGLKAQVAPGSFFWHRTAGPATSYFERVFSDGRLNLNTYLIYEDMISLFSSPAIEEIMRADLFQKTGFGADSLSERLEKMQKDGIGVLAGERDKPAQGDFVQGVDALLKKDYGTALTRFARVAEKGPSTSLVDFNILRCLSGLSGVEWPGAIEESLRRVEKLQLVRVPSARGWSMLKRGLVKLARVVIASQGFEDPLPRLVPRNRG